MTVAAAASPAAADPQPDAAPQAPAVAPDPAPEAAPETPSTDQQQPPPEGPAPPTTAPPVQGRQYTQPAETSTPAAPRTHRDGTRKRHHASGQVAGAQTASAFRFHSLLPAESDAGDSPQHEVLLAAGALLALVLASGSLVSVGARAMKGQMR